MIRMDCGADDDARWPRPAAVEANALFIEGIRGDQARFERRRSPSIPRAPTVSSTALPGSGTLAPRDHAVVDDVVAVAVNAGDLIGN